MYRNDLIIAHMDTQRLTVRKVQATTGLSKDTISRARGGDTGVSIGNLLIIAEAVRLPKKALLDDDYPLPVEHSASEKAEKYQT